MDLCIVSNWCSRSGFETGGESEESFAPHLPQNASWAETSLPHLEQMTTSFVPQAEQKALLLGFSVRHDGHFTR